MSDKGFAIPADAHGATDLTAPALNKATAIQAEDRVLCFNRGQKPLTDQFDGRHIVMPVGYFEMEFAAAQHFQRRLIVPGTRNLVDDSHVSYIGILGTADGRIRRDTEEYCIPFTRAQLEKFGEKVEGLDRGAGLDPVTPLATGVAVAATMRSTGKGMKPRIDVSQQASPDAAAAAEHVLDKPEGSAAREAEAEAAADGLAKPAARRGR